jgi:hypothetical protein
MPIAIFSESQTYLFFFNYTQADSHIVGWTGPSPTLSRKRPTADLVSRKVLTPLLGQIALVVLGQLAIFKTVQLQPW